MIAPYLASSSVNNFKPEKKGQINLKKKTIIRLGLKVF